MFSAGLTSGEINSKLVEYLSKIGYKITKIEKEGKMVYEVRFSDKSDPIIIFSKTATDKSLPKKDVRSIIVCDIKTEIDCANLKTETPPLNLAFPKIIISDTDEKIQAELKSIAAEMVYVTKKTTE